MKKADLISALAAHTNVSKAEVTDVLNALGELAKEVIADGNEFTLGRSVSNGGQRSRHKRFSHL